eukprot:1189153-Prorocentrum_minimum.AAC.3
MGGGGVKGGAQQDVTRRPHSLRLAVAFGVWCNPKSTCRLQCCCNPCTSPQHWLVPDSPPTTLRPPSAT